jgi:hypothetical protein
MVGIWLFKRLLGHGCTSGYGNWFQEVFLLPGKNGCCHVVVGCKYVAV